MENKNRDMEIIVDIARIRKNRIEYFQYTTNEKLSALHRAVLEKEKRKIINLLNELKEKGIIKNPNCPMNKRYKEELRQLVKAKKILNRSIDKIKTMFINN
jgi:hypothetical protein